MQNHRSWGVLLPFPIGNSAEKRPGADNFATSNDVKLDFAAQHFDKETNLAKTFSKDFDGDLMEHPGGLPWENHEISLVIMGNIMEYGDIYGNLLGPSWMGRN